MISPDYFDCELEGYELVSETNVIDCPDGSTMECGGPGYICQNENGDTMETIAAEPADMIGNLYFLWVPYCFFSDGLMFLQKVSREKIFVHWKKCQTNLPKILEAGYVVFTATVNGVL